MAPVSAARSGPEGDEPMEVVSVNDGNQIKRVLDDTATQVVLGAGYTEDNTVNNLKIGVGLVAIAFAAVAQFYPLKFPQNFTVLLVCVAGYVACTVALHVYSYWHGHDTILWTLPKKGMWPRGAPVVLSSSMPRYSATYTLAIRSGGGSPHARRPQVSMRRQVTAWFHKTGEFEEASFEGDVAKLVEDFESGPAGAPANGKKAD